MKEVRSFDVFDTCLTRRVGVPTALFYDVAQRAFARLGIVLTQSLMEDFVAARIAAEQTARQKARREDIKLEEIWRILLCSMGWKMDITMALCELEAEEASLVPIASMRKMVQACRRENCRIVFVSDMYLPAEFIWSQLRKHGFAENGDGLYVSGDIGKIKATGNLFKHVLYKENVSAAKVRHTGDNKHSDYDIPHQLGIRAELFKDAHLSEVEHRLLQTSPDLPAASRLVGAIRSFRLEHEDGDEPVSELTSQFIAPVVMGFALWVLKRAQANNVKRLYFLSRDCQLTWKVACELAPLFDNIDCRYLYVSRQALYLPSATEISPEGMPWMRRSFEEPVLKSLLAKIELRFEDVQAIFKELVGDENENYRLRSELDWKQFWCGLNQEPIKERLNELIVSRREMARQYFESQGLFDTESWAVVDLGWYLTGQQALWKILRMFGWKKAIQGIYLALRQGRVGCDGAGISEALFYQLSSDFPADKAEENIFSRQTLLEHIVGCADHPTVHHYEINGGQPRPAFATPVNEVALMLCHKLHDQVLAFATYNEALAKDFKNARMVRESIASISAFFFQHPTKKTAMSLNGLYMGCDQNGLDSQRVVRPLTIREIFRMVLPHWVSLTQLPKASPYFWSEGSLAITPRSTIRIARMIQWPIKLVDMWITRWHRLSMQIAIRTRLRRLIHTNNAK